MAQDLAWLILGCIEIWWCTGKLSSSRWWGAVDFSCIPAWISMPWDIFLEDSSQKLLLRQILHRIVACLHKNIHIAQWSVNIKNTYTFSASRLPVFVVFFFNLATMQPCMIIMQCVKYLCQAWSSQGLYNSYFSHLIFILTESQVKENMCKPRSSMYFYCINILWFK